MDLRPLGSTGILVSPIGLGTVKLGRTIGVKYPRAYSLPDDDAATHLLNAAADLGVNLLDTAPAYGRSEERLGSLLARGVGGGRDRWIISTKAGEEFTESAAVSTYDFSPAAVTASIDRSLRRLRTDHIDILLLHSDGRDEWIVNQSGAPEALLAARAAGKIIALGISAKTPDPSIAAAFSPASGVLMCELSPADSSQLPLIEAAANRGTGVLLKKVLASGHLPIAQSTDLAPHHAAPTDPASACIRYAFHRAPQAAASVIGTINPAHLAAAVAAARAALR